MDEAVRAAIRSGFVRSAHDLAEGGLIVALAECAIAGAKQLGATVKLDGSNARLDALLFGESQSRALLTASPEKAAALLSLLQAHGVPAQQIGTVGGTDLVLSQTVAGASRQLTYEVASLYQAWDSALDQYLT